MAEERTTEAPSGFDSAVRNFQAINEFLSVDDDSLVSVPCRALLKRLPDNLRGPAWQPTDFPDNTLQVDREQLLSQLRKGRVLFPLRTFLGDIPEDWIIHQPDAMVDLDLPEVVAAVPPELLKPKGKTSDAVIEVAAMRDYFAPKSVAADAEEAEAEAPAVAAPSAPTAPPPPVAPVAGSVPAPSQPQPAAAGDTQVPGPAEVAAAPEPVERAPLRLPFTPAAATPPAAPAEPPPAPSETEVGIRLEQPTAPAPSETDVEIRLEEPAAPAQPVADLATAAFAELPDETVVGEPEPEPEAPLAEPPEAVVPPAPEPAAPVFPPLDEPAFQEVDEALPEEAADATPAREEMEEAPAAEPQWDGVERSLGSAAAGVDVNTASLTELEQLPGVGPARARLIVDYRDVHGAFASIYDLARVPGIGPTVFRQMTGLSPAARRNRHRTVRRLLGLPLEESPSLPTMVQTLTNELGATGALLTTREGIQLSATGRMSLDRKKSDRYAAFCSQFALRTRSYLTRLGIEGGDCVFLPSASPSVMLLVAGDVVLVTTFEDTCPVPSAVSHARAVVCEFGWLLGRRGIVRGL